VAGSKALPSTHKLASWEMALCSVTCSLLLLLDYPDKIHLNLVVLGAFGCDNFSSLEVKTLFLSVVKNDYLHRTQLIQVGFDILHYEE
jgi:hypothetical protein